MKNAPLLDVDIPENFDSELGALRECEGDVPEEYTGSDHLATVKAKIDTYADLLSSFASIASFRMLAFNAVVSPSEGMSEMILSVGDTIIYRFLLSARGLEFAGVTDLYDRLVSDTEKLMENVDKKSAIFVVKMLGGVRHSSLHSDILSALQMISELSAQATRVNTPIEYATFVSRVSSGNFEIESYATQSGILSIEQFKRKL